MQSLEKKEKLIKKIKSATNSIRKKSLALKIGEKDAETITKKKYKPILDEIQNLRKNNSSSDYNYNPYFSPRISFPATSTRRNSQFSEHGQPSTSYMSFSDKLHVPQLENNIVGDDDVEILERDDKNDILMSEYIDSSSDNSDYSKNFNKTKYEIKPKKEILTESNDSSDYSFSDKDDKKEEKNIIKVKKRRNSIDFSEEEGDKKKKILIEKIKKKDKKTKSTKKNKLNPVRLRDNNISNKSKLEFPTVNRPEIYFSSSNELDIDQNILTPENNLDKPHFNIPEKKFSNNSNRNKQKKRNNHARKIQKKNRKQMKNKRKIESADEDFINKTQPLSKKPAYVSNTDLDNYESETDSNENVRSIKKIKRMNKNDIVKKKKKC